MIGSPGDKEGLQAGRLGLSHWAGPSVTGSAGWSQRWYRGIIVDILAKESKFPWHGNQVQMGLVLIQGQSDSGHGMAVQVAQVCFRVGAECRQIAQEIGVHYSTISKFHSKLNFTPPKGKGGCPSKLTPTAICHAIHIISTGKADTAVDVTKSLQETFPGTISASTVRRGLKKSGLKAVVKTKGPVLSQHHHRERLDFSKAHEHWTVEDWKRVIWSDGVTPVTLP